MAMSETGSSFAHWAGLYDPDPSPEPRATIFAADGSNNAVVVAAATSPTSAGSGGSPTKASAVPRPGIEGPRVGKPAARRRSRASRRAPVTLLNTDTANFRAMVQQFTGIPAPPAGAFGGPVINFAGDYGFPPPAGVMSFDHVHRSQHHPDPAPLHEQLRRQQQQPQYTGGSFGYNSLLHGASAGDVFASAEDRVLLQSLQTAQMPPAPAANNTSLGFFA